MKYKEELTSQFDEELRIQTEENGHVLDADLETDEYIDLRNVYLEMTPEEKTIIEKAEVQWVGNDTGYETYSVKGVPGVDKLEYSTVYIDEATFARDMLKGLRDYITSHITPPKKALDTGMLQSQTAGV